ncbi:hypothetical protein COU74_01290 [Candidatus Peregrinibacteria bacterium CG10_big_fil_rev_8_21_14_0_10_36_19]|nr:MAG: hypothetical protein COU74_01290 [Candidatus Peregrinibacteria bacterium CG10_big_fil_rev_8_21_14_0_10_36_19]
MRQTHDIQEGGIEHRDAGNMDAMVIISNYECQNFSPDNYPGFLSAATAGQIDSVMSGTDCHMIFLDPQITEGCEIDGAVATTGSIKFGDQPVTVFNLKSGAYNIQDGQVLYQAYRGVCNEFPSAKVMVLGIELNPSGKGIKASIATEKGENGQPVARVHIWDGEGYLTLDGSEVIKVQKGEQVVVSPEGGNLNLLEAHGNAQPPADAPVGGENYTYVSHSADGCSASPTVPSSPLATVELTAAMVAAILRMYTRKRASK